MVQTKKVYYQELLVFCIELGLYDYTHIWTVDNDNYQSKYI